MDTENLAWPMIYGCDPDSEINGLGVFFITNEDYWKENKRCSDTLNRGSYNLITELGFAELEGGVWEDTKEERTVEEAKKELEEVGFVYDKEFEDFMKESAEDE